MDFRSSHSADLERRRASPDMYPRAAALLADCGGTIGLGHLRRMLVLAAALAESGLYVRIATPGGFGDRLVRAAGFEPFSWPRLPSDLPPHALLAIDHYAVDVATVAAWRKRATLCLAIDDLADHPLDADLVLNQNLYAAELRYDAIASCPVLRGPDYALVDPAFHAVACSRETPGRRVLVSFGGSDDGTLALGAARVLRRAGFAGPIDAVVSPLQSVIPELLETASRPDTKITLYHGGGMPALMADAFLYVGGAGTTIFEAAVAGVAMLPIGIAENQRRGVEALRRHGIDAFMGFDTDRLAAALRRVLNDPASALLRGVVAPNGAQRVIRTIFARLAPRIDPNFRCVSEEVRHGQFRD